jgi:hypothetical protein
MQNVFQARYNQIRAQIPQTPFAVILWGPGPGSLALYNKRVQIRDELRLREQAAMLAEELPQIENLEIMPRLARLMQAASADLVVVMVATMNELAGAHEFNADAAVKSKLIIFAPGAAVTPEYQAVLSDLSARYDNVRSFIYPGDIESCHLRALVIDKLGEMQVAKWHAQKTLEASGAPKV